MPERTSRGEGRTANWRRIATLIVIGVTTVGLLVVSARDLSYRLADSDLSRAEQGGDVATTSDRLEAIDEARGKVLQAVLGLSVLLSAFVAWQRYRVNEEEVALSRRRHSLAEEAATDARVAKAVELLGNESPEVVAAAVGILGSVMRRRDAANDPAALELAALLSGVVVSRSKVGEHGAGSGPDVVVEAVLRAFADLSRDSTVVLNLRSANLSNWSIDLPAHTEVYLDGVNLSGSSLRGFETYVRLKRSEASELGLARSDGLVYDDEG